MPNGEASKSDLQGSGDRYSSNSRPGFLLLEDGALFSGRVFGALPSSDSNQKSFNSLSAVANVVFDTRIVGYQELLSNPTTAGHAVVMTAPLIGNYGIISDAVHSVPPQVAAVIVRELSPTYSSWTASGSLSAWLEKYGIPVLTEVDTRRLTRHLRDHGSMRGIVVTGRAPGRQVDMDSADTEAAIRELLSQLKAPSSETAFAAVTGSVTTSEPYSLGTNESATHLIVYDFGLDSDTLRSLESADAKITVVPADTPLESVLGMSPSGVLLSNGPGNPADLPLDNLGLKKLSDAGIPILGTGLGHQLIARAWGGETVKLKAGHHGSNHPVQELSSGRVEITSQSHCFAVKGDVGGVSGADDLEVTHVNLNDGSIEGIRHRSAPIYGLQFTPPSGRGRYDAEGHLNQFLISLRKS